MAAGRSGARGGGGGVRAAERLVLRPVSAGQLRAARPGGRDVLFTQEWVPVTDAVTGDGQLAVLGGDQTGVAADLVAAGVAVSGHADLAGLAEAARAGQQ